MLRRRGEPRIKLIDFGLSRRILPGTIVKDMIGTPEFVGKSIVAFSKLSIEFSRFVFGLFTSTQGEEGGW